MIRTLMRMLLLMLLVTGTEARSQSPDELIGIWRASLDYPRLGGPLVVRKTRSGFVATIGKLQATSPADPRNLRFAFRGGSFRGQHDGNKILGFWIQPNRDVPAQANPGGSYQSFATPLQLRPISAAAWRGEVVPLSDRYTLWLSIFRAPEGGMTAAFRNPEANSTGGASRFEVKREGDTIRFSAKRDQTEITQQARLLHAPDRIRIVWNDAGATVDLVRLRPAQAIAFYPRPPQSPPYVYRKPPVLGDGWRTARASATGLDEQDLQGVVRAIAGADPTARPPQLFHSILVAHRGRLVLEEYFYGFDRSTPHDTRSAGKTFASILLGTEPARNAGLSTESRIYDVMRPLGRFANPDPRKAQIRLAHLLTHSSGLACNDNDNDSPGNEGTMQMQNAEPNWWRYTLNLPQVYAPGTRYAYCSANINLVGGALTLATRTWLPELYRRTIAEPLQFGEWHWNVMPTGEGYLGGGAFLLPRDLIKVGQMYLDGGIWNGRRIVPAEWVKLSTSPRIEVSPQTTGLSEDEFGNFYGRAHDALAWHLGSVKSGGRDYPTYAATGNGGQLLLVVPDFDLVVVFTGGNYQQGGVWTRWPQQIVGDMIIPAIRPLVGEFRSD